MTAGTKYKTSVRPLAILLQGQGPMLWLLDGAVGNHSSLETGAAEADPTIPR